MSIGTLKIPIYYWESRRPCTCGGLCMFSLKTGEGSKLSPLKNLEALYEQEAKTEAEI